MLDQRKTVDVETIRVLLVDDQTILCDTFAAAMGAEPDISVHTATSLTAALRAIEECGQFDVVLLDYDMPECDGLAALGQIMEANGKPVAFFSGMAGRSIVERALRAGARGFLPKTISLRAMRHAIKYIASGEIFLPAEYLQDAGSPDRSRTGLSPRQLRVLSLLCEGMKNKEIAASLGLPETIVKVDVKAIYKRFAVGNRTQAVLEARRRKLF